MIDPKDRFDDKELEAAKVEIGRIEIPEDIVLLLDKIVDDIPKYNAAIRITEQEGTDDYETKNEIRELYVSDRRWKWIGRLLKASAFFNDRSAATWVDFFLVRYCIWGEHRHIAAVDEMILDALPAAIATSKIECFDRRWSRIRGEFEALGEAVHLPRPYGDWYEISAGASANLLTGRDDLQYTRIGRVDFDMLGKKFSPITVSSKAGSVLLEGRKLTPSEVILRNVKNGTLKSFPETTFKLETQEKTGRWVQNDSGTGEWQEGATSLKAEVLESKNASANAKDQFVSDSRQYLFAKIPDRYQSGVVDGFQKLDRGLSQIAGRIDDFLRGKGLG
jgi:hypothetical protein